MDIDQFIQACKNLDDGSFELQRISNETLKSFSIAEPDIEFFTKCGLPESAAPFLNFEGERVKWEEEYFGIDMLISKYPFLDGSFSKYVCIGHNGYGDPIVLDLVSNMVEVLNHDNEFEPVFMNSSVFNLAKFLLVYRQFVSETISLNGQDAFSNRKFLDEQILQVKEKFEAIDPKAIQIGFWHEELKYLLIVRDKSDNNKS